jgi:hypothetical protein
MSCRVVARCEVTTPQQLGLAGAAPAGVASKAVTAPNARIKTRKRLIQSPFYPGSPLGNRSLSQSNTRDFTDYAVAGRLSRLGEGVHPQGHSVDELIQLVGGVQRMIVSKVLSTRARPPAPP